MNYRVCVIIPAYNEEDVIDDCLAALDRQTLSNFEVFVIDDASTDRTREIILRYSQKNPTRFRLFEFGKVGPGKARNLAALETKAELLAFTDADCIPSPDWLSELVKAFDLEAIGSAGGPHLAPPQSNDFQRSVERFLKLASPLTDFYKQGSNQVRPTSHNPLCNVAYRRDLFNRLGGFREDLFPGEDVEMDLRVKKAGFKIMYVPHALVFHHRPESISQWRKVMHAYGRAQGKLLRENGPQRLIQWLGILSITTLLYLFTMLVSFFQLEGFFLFAIIALFVFKFRPDWENFISICFNSLQWLNGFCQVFVTKRSDPPGYKPLSLSERRAALHKSEPKDK